jgi:hypothetical protein
MTAAVLAHDEAELLQHDEVRRVPVLELEATAVARALGRVGALVEARIEYLGLEVPVYPLEPVWKSNFGSPRHRRDVVSVATSARWRGLVDFHTGWT